jgi:hypothetical protein
MIAVEIDEVDPIRTAGSHEVPEQLIDVEIGAAQVPEVPVRRITRVAARA